MCFSLRRHLHHSINHVFLGLLPRVLYVSLPPPFVSLRVFFSVSCSFFSNLAVPHRLSEGTSLEHPRTENVNTHIVILAHLEDLREKKEAKAHSWEEERMTRSDGAKATSH